MFALIQERTPGSLLGRANSAVVAVAGSTAPLGYLLVGYLVEAAGAHSGVGACAAVYLLVALTSVLNPAMKEIGHSFLRVSCASCDGRGLRRP